MAIFACLVDGHGREKLDDGVNKRSQPAAERRGGRQASHSVNGMSTQCSFGLDLLDIAHSQSILPANIVDIYNQKEKLMQGYHATAGSDIPM